MIAAAQQEVARRESNSNSSSDEDGSSKEDIETDSEARTKNEGKQDTVPRGTKTLQLAALEFCIELLNQTIQQHKTEIALVCALAVLGIHLIGKGF